MQTRLDETDESESDACHLACPREILERPENSIHLESGTSSDEKVLPEGCSRRVKCLQIIINNFNIEWALQIY